MLEILRLTCRTIAADTLQNLRAWFLASGLPHGLKIITVALAITSEFWAGSKKKEQE